MDYLLLYAIDGLLKPSITLLLLLQALGYVFKQILLLIEGENIDHFNISILLPCFRGRILTILLIVYNRLEQESTQLFMVSH